MKELQFYNRYIEKPTVKCLKNFDLPSELSFYEEINVVKTRPMFRGYDMSYKIESVEKKIQLNS